jgi:transposase
VDKLIRQQYGFHTYALAALCTHNMLQLLPVGAIPTDTVRVAQATVPEGNTYLKHRNFLSTIFDDTLFAPLFSRRGQPASAPWRLSLVTILQFAEGLEVFARA